MKIHPTFIIALLLINTSCSYYTSIEKALENPLEVKRIKIKNGNVPYLPPEIAQCKNLEELYIFRSGLMEVPAEIGELKKLKTLILSSNQIETLPPEIGNLKKPKIYFSQT